MQDNLSKYRNSENYHYTMYSYNTNKYVIKDIYCLGEKKLVSITNVVDGEKTVNKVFINADKMNIYTEKNNKKIANINKDGRFYEQIPDNLYTENFLQTIIGSAFASVKKVKCNGIESYYVENFASPFVLSEGGIYLNKDTGLPIRVMSSNSITNFQKENQSGEITDYIFEFNNVKEENFQEPNIADYEVQ
ncbi:hypothetical protein D3C87_1599180 [compost metagenome]